MNFVLYDHNLCDFQFDDKHKNRSRQRFLHLLNYHHFKQKIKEELGDIINKAFPNCPHEGCDYQKKSKYRLTFHYVARHGFLNKYVEEEIMKKEQKLNSASTPETSIIKSCELCDYKFVSKRHITRDRFRHLQSYHFKQKIEEELGDIINQSLPNCPHKGCGYKNSSKNALTYHSVSKHGFLNMYVEEEKMKIQQKSNFDKMTIKSPVKSINSKKSKDSSDGLDMSITTSWLKGNYVTKKSCELCGFKFVSTTGNRSRERFLHLQNNHFKEKIKEELDDAITKSIPNCLLDGCDYKNNKNDYTHT